MRLMASAFAVILATTALAESTPVEQAIAQLPKGFLNPAAIPDAQIFLPPPPVRGSPAELRDQQLQKAALKRQGGPRWEMATADADLFTPRATGALSCAAGFDISPDNTPKLDKLLRRTLMDFALTTRAAKAKYSRARPFIVNGKPQCTPEMDKLLRSDGSYPSGHATIGMGWSLIVAQLVPDRAAPLVARGAAFAESRRFCNVHWQSDTEAGTDAAQAVMATLNADPAFRATLDEAKAELADPAVRARAPSRDCIAEKAALALQ